MRIPRLPREVALLIIGLGIALALGLCFGKHFGEMAAHNRDVVLRFNQTQQLQAMKGEIAIGKPFPCFTVWTTHGDTAFAVHDLLPEGGVILLVGPGCVSCIDAAVKLDHVLARDTLWTIPGILLADQARGAAKMEQLLNARGLVIPIYCDVEEELRRNYGISPNPAYFCLDSAGTVLDLGAGTPDGTHIGELMRNCSTPRQWRRTTERR